MSGRLTRLVALAAMVTHIWVNLVVAPWHHLVEHQLPAAVAARNDAQTLRGEHCHCHHHSHCKTAPVDSTSPGSSSDLPSSDVPIMPHGSDGVPHDGDSCPVCHVLSQHSARLEVVLDLPVRAPRLLTVAELAIQPSLGALIDPVSRGPPAV